jgi:spore coat polysaccharide biosynthesis predicted glycosyltransferase SpsG
MEDEYSCVYPADLLINYNINSNDIAYAAHYAGTATELLLGPKYTPLRAQIRGLRPVAGQGRLRRVLVSAGGSNSDGVAFALVRRLLREPDFTDIHFVAMPGVFGDNVQLAQLSKENPRFTLNPQPQAIQEIMRKCDAAVSAGGFTLYELCACGVPTAVYSIADNQTGARKAFGAMRAMIDCGDFRDGATECIEKIIGALKSLQSPATRAFLRQKAYAVTDGFGAVHIAKSLVYFADKRYGRG